MALHDEQPKSDGANDVKDADFGRDHEQESDNFDTESHNSETQAGVKKVEAISKTWTTASLAIAYVA